MITRLDICFFTAIGFVLIFYLTKLALKLQFLFIIKYGKTDLHQVLLQKLRIIDLIHPYILDFKKVAMQETTVFLSSPTYISAIVSLKEKLEKLTTAYSKISSQDLRVEDRLHYYSTLSKAKKYLKDFELLVF